MKKRHFCTFSVVFFGFFVICTYKSGIYTEKRHSFRHGRITRITRHVEEVERDVAIARWVFPQIFLMAIVSGIKIRERQYLDCRRYLQRRLEPAQLVEDDRKIPVGIRIVYTCPITCAAVFPLSVERCRIYGFEEKLQEESQGDSIRVICYGDSFGEAGLVGIYLFIGRVGNIAVGESHLCGEDTGNKREKVLETPETSAGKADVIYGTMVAAAEKRYNVGHGR